MSTKSKVLESLETNKPNFVSGEKLAQNLGLSRSAVWKAIKTLEREGYKIDSSTSSSGFPRLDQIMEVAMPKDFMAAVRRFSSLRSSDPSLEESTRVISAVSPSAKAKLQNWDLRVSQRRIKAASPLYDTRILPCGVRFHKKYTIASLPKNEKYLGHEKTTPRERIMGSKPTLRDVPLPPYPRPPPRARDSGIPSSPQGLWAHPHKSPGR